MMANILSNAIVRLRLIRFFLRFSSRHRTLERLPALLVELWMREWLAWQHLVAHRGIEDEDGFHGRGLGQVFLLQALVRIHIGVVRTAAVIKRVLDELESRYAHGVKGLVVSAAGLAHGDGGHAQVFERFHPLREDG